jgi:hypothetical protein
MRNSIIKGVAAFSLFFALPAGAQNSTSSDTKPVRKTEYKNAIGIRVATTPGITFKHFMNQGHAFELLLGIWPNAVGLTGLYEKHDGTGLEGLKFYYGGGAHVTVETGRNAYRYGRYRRDEYRYRYGPNGAAVGVDGVVGLDYKIPVIPMAISLDLKPYLEVSNYGDVWVALDAGLGIKVAF